MSEWRDDFIYQMLEETYALFNDNRVELQFDAKKGFIQFQSLQIPINFGPFKDLTNQEVLELEIGEHHSYYEAICIIFKQRPSFFQFYWQQQKLWVKYNSVQHSRAA